MAHAPSKSARAFTKKEKIMSRVALVLWRVCWLSIALVAMYVVSTQPAFASGTDWGQWHVVRYTLSESGPYTNVQQDLVRSKRTATGTRCDFLIHNAYDGKLVSYTTTRACVPGRIVYFN